ncbi:hypothetical protein BHU16_01295 [Tannerella sp. oral taxon 808]|nr:hypothetical protein BHU16_01295 [Tannerella sp. oral taxon 808]
MHRISERASHALEKKRVIPGAHGVLGQNEATISARMACGSKTRQVFGAHGVLEQNEGHFGRA